MNEKFKVYNYESGSLHKIFGETLLNTIEGARDAVNRIKRSHSYYNSVQFVIVIYSNNSSKIIEVL